MVAAVKSFPEVAVYHVMSNDGNGYTHMEPDDNCSSDVCQRSFKVFERFAEPPRAPGFADLPPSICQFVSGFWDPYNPLRPCFPFPSSSNLCLSLTSSPTFRHHFTHTLLQSRSFHHLQFLYCSSFPSCSSSCCFYSFLALL